MQLTKIIKSERLFFRTLMSNDAEGAYHRWLHDPLVNQYLEVRHHIPDIAALKDYIDKMNQASDSLLLAVCLLTGKHIGNIKLGPIDWEKKTGTLGLLIGDKESWNKGYATEAISALTDFGFKELGLKKISAGCYANNLGSYYAFMKSGYTDIGTFNTIIKMEKVVV